MPKLRLRQAGHLHSHRMNHRRSHAGHDARQFRRGAQGVARGQHKQARRLHLQQRRLLQEYEYRVYQQKSLLQLCKQDCKQVVSIGVPCCLLCVLRALKPMQAMSAEET